MSIFTAWTDGQWTVFAGLTVSGLSALGLLIIAFRIMRGWTAPAQYAAASATRPRPSIEAAARRTLLDPHMGTLITAAYESAALGVPTTADDSIRRHDGTGRAWDRADVKSQPGPGSIVSIAEAEGVYGPRDEDVDADVHTLFGAWEDGWRRSVNVALAPAMLKAVLWAIEGEQAGVSGAGRLQEWYQTTPTQGWPLVRVDDRHPYATAS